MYQDFNMGVGFEFIVEKESVEDIISIIEGFGVGASIIGRCEKAKSENCLQLTSRYGSFNYT
jgi:phosphoribosylaminoimidazole (AIR) synthetase